MEKAFEYDGYRFFAQWKDGELPQTVIYCHEGEDKEELRKLWALVDEPRLMLVSISGVDWDRQLSPWPAGKAFKGGDVFSGKADEYIGQLEEIIPRLEAELRTQLKEASPGADTENWPSRRGIAGYSLGGLFAVYCFYKTELFSLLGSMSGSLWFDKFRKYMSERRLKTVPEKAYFSLGDKEPQVKNQRMAAVGECTELAEKLFREKGAGTVFEWNEGGHFNDVQLRVAKGLRWLAEE
ncbi:MAG: alpha/beta hydrolase [Firmicutes bacterium]|nr:alpha/beta hydrolase [Bacillota bacterium]